LNRDVLSRIPFVIAVALTILWVALLAAYVRNVGWAGLSAFTPVELATLLAAAGGPPAVVWLFVAVVEQRRTVTQLLAQSRHSLQQAETQTRALLQLQNEVSRSQSQTARGLAVHDLAANAAILAERLGVTSRENAAAAWARYGAGDVTVFVQSFLNFAISHPDMPERIADAVKRDSLARAALSGFVRRFERLSQALADDKMAMEIVEEGALGRAYRLFKHADDMAAAPPGRDDLFDGDLVAERGPPEPVV
jgi:hypothetical protein